MRMGRRKLYQTNKSGTTGVSWHKLTSKWIANVSIKGKQKYLGSFRTVEEAIAAREAMIQEQRLYT